MSVDGEELTQDEIRALIEVGGRARSHRGQMGGGRRGPPEEGPGDVEGAEENTVTVAEAMRMAAGIDESPFPDAEVRNGKWLKDMVRRMREADFPEEEAPE